MRKSISHPTMVGFARQIFVFVGLCVIPSCLSQYHPSILPPTQEVVKYENESYFVTCQAEYVNHTSKIIWTKGTKNKIGDKGLTHVAPYGNGKALFFEKISTTDSGEYVCHNHEETAKFKLIVISPINFVDTLPKQTVKEHRPGFIKCKVKGDPKPTVLWKHEGKELPANKYKIMEDGLQILNVSLEDRGIYTCRAFQVTQDASMYIENNIELNIQHKPHHKKPVHAKVNEAYGFVGGIVNLTCEAVAEPAANFTWYRQHKKTMPGRIIEEPHWSVLQLYIQNSSVFGDYLCKASNSLGTLDQIITLQEGIKPPPPRLLALRGAGSDTLELDIVGPDMNQTRKELPAGMLPTGYRVEYKIKEIPKDEKTIKSKKENRIEKEKKRVEGITEGWEEAYVVEFTDGLEEDDQYPYFLSNLIHNTIYEVRVATRNIAGLSEFVGPYEYRTLRLHADPVTSGACVLATQISVILNLLFVWFVIV